MSAIVDDSRPTVTIDGEAVQVASVGLVGPSGADGSDGADGADGADGGTWTSASLSVKKSLEAYVDKPDRGADLNLWGGLENVATGEALAAGNDITVTVGTGKVVLAILAGTDFAGTLTIAGDTVDRNTGAVTVGDTEDITVDALTTDGGSTDAGGNHVHGLTNAYMTTKWFEGAITISTSDLDLSNVSVGNIAFHQFGDTAVGVELDAFDLTAYCANGSAEIYGHLYSVEVPSAGKVNIVSEADISITSAQAETARHHRRKIGGIGKALTPSSDGVFADFFPLPLNQRYWEDISIIIIYNSAETISFS